MNTVPDKPPKANEVFRRIVISEHVGDPFKCAFCKRAVPDGMGYTATIIEPGERLPVDGYFCSWSCAETEAKLAVIVDAYLSDESHPGHEKLIAAVKGAA